MRIDAVSIGKNTPHEVNVIIEVPVGGEPIKYEMDKEAGTLVVDRFLYTPMRYPGNYGFIPHTLSDDGDPCDVLIVNTRAIIPGAVMSVRPVGVLFMEDEAGGDEKILAVPSSKLTQRYDKVKTYSDLPDITLQQIQHFFEHYKDLEPGKWVKILRWGGPEDAHKLILEGVEREKKKKSCSSFRGRCVSIEPGIRESHRARFRVRLFEPPPGMQNVTPPASAGLRSRKPRAACSRAGRRPSSGRRRPAPA